MFAIDFMKNRDRSVYIYSKILNVNRDKNTRQIESPSFCVSLLEIYLSDSKKMKYHKITEEFNEVFCFRKSWCSHMTLSMEIKIVMPCLWRLNPANKKMLNNVSYIKMSIKVCTIITLINF